MQGVVQSKSIEVDEALSSVTSNESIGDDEMLTSTHKVQSLPLLAASLVESHRHLSR